MPSIRQLDRSITFQNPQAIKTLDPSKIAALNKTAQTAGDDVILQDDSGETQILSVDEFLAKGDKFANKKGFLSVTRNGTTTIIDLAKLNKSSLQAALKQAPQQVSSQEAAGLVQGAQPLLDKMRTTKSTALPLQTPESPKPLSQKAKANQYQTRLVKTTIFKGSQYTNNQPGIPPKVRATYGITQANIAAWEKGEVATEGPFKGKSLEAVVSQMSKDMAMDKQYLFQPVKVLSQLGRAINIQRAEQGQLSPEAQRASSAQLKQADQMVGGKWEQYHAQASRELHGAADSAMDNLKAAQKERPVDFEKVEAATEKARLANGKVQKFSKVMVSVEATKLEVMGPTDARRAKLADKLYKQAKTEANSGHLEDAIDGAQKLNNGVPWGYTRAKDLLASADDINPNNPVLHPDRLNAKETLTEGIRPYAIDALNRYDERLIDADMTLTNTKKMSEDDFKTFKKELALSPEDQETMAIYAEGGKGLSGAYAEQIGALESKPNRTSEDEKTLSDLKSKKADFDTRTEAFKKESDAVLEREQKVVHKALKIKVATDRVEHGSLTGQVKTDIKNWKTDYQGPQSSYFEQWMSSNRKALATDQQQKLQTKMDEYEALKAKGDMVGAAAMLDDITKDMNTYMNQSMAEAHAAEDTAEQIGKGAEYTAMVSGAVFTGAAAIVAAPAVAAAGSFVTAGLGGGGGAAAAGFVAETLASGLIIGGAEAVRQGGTEVIAASTAGDMDFDDTMKAGADAYVKGYTEGFVSGASGRVVDGLVSAGGKLFGLGLAAKEGEKVVLKEGEKALAKELEKTVVKEGEKAASKGGWKAAKEAGSETLERVAKEKAAQKGVVETFREVRKEGFKAGAKKLRDKAVTVAAKKGAAQMVGKPIKPVVEAIIPEDLRSQEGMDARDPNSRVFQRGRPEMKKDGKPRVPKKDDQVFLVNDGVNNKVVILPKGAKKPENAQEYKVEGEVFKPDGKTALPMSDQDWERFEKPTFGYTADKVLKEVFDIGSGQAMDVTPT